MTHLTERQGELLVAYADTCDLRAAAHRLGITWQTARNHRTHVLERLGVSSTIEAYVVLGWLAVPDHMRTLRGPVAVDVPFGDEADVSAASSAHRRAA